MTSATATEPILFVDHLVARYGAIEALHGVTLRVMPGKIVCLIGANGAGKSTLLRTISGLLPAASGAINYTPDRTLQLHRTPAHKIVAAGVSHVPEGRGIFPNMSVRENLDLGAYLQSDRTKLEIDRQRPASAVAGNSAIRSRAASVQGTARAPDAQLG